MLILTALLEHSVGEKQTIGLWDFFSFLFEHKNQKNWIQPHERSNNFEHPETPEQIRSPTERLLIKQLFIVEIE